MISELGEIIVTVKRMDYSDEMVAPKQGNAWRDTTDAGLRDSDGN
jgi:hypothetical protein